MHCDKIYGDIIFLTDFFVHMQDRPQVECGGGIVCCIKSCLSHNERKDLVYNQDGIESMVFETIMKKQKWFL